MQPRFTVIGISDTHRPEFSAEVIRLITSARVFSGGRRHRQIVTPLLPDGALWIDITAPLDNVFRQYENHQDIVVFASGDPLFFGFANTLRKRLPEAVIHVYPAFHSLQLLAHKILMPYQHLHMVSLTGRSWGAFDAALIEGQMLIGCLTDPTHSPSAIARYMLQYGYDNYDMVVGELLGNETEECITTCSLAEASERTFAFPNCLMLRQLSPRLRSFGLREQDFAWLDGRERMITKMPVRLAVMHYLQLERSSVLWDVGFCTGSVGIEAKSHFPALQVIAFEKRPVCKDLLHQNMRRFGVPGIVSVMGDFLDVPLDSHPRPDAVFLGGYGGQMEAVLKRIVQVLLPRGRVVFNSVSEQSAARFRNLCLHLGLTITAEMRLAVDSHHPIEIIQACKS